MTHTDLFTKLRQLKCSNSISILKHPMHKSC